MDAFVNGINIHYADVGDPSDLPIVLLHAMALDQGMWQPQIDLLKETCRVVAYDMRGHGRSEVSDGQFTHRQLADDLVGVLDHLHIERAVLCGISMGGAIALRTAECYPERIRALILCNTTCNADSNESKWRREKAIQAIKKEGLKTFADEFLSRLFSFQSYTVHREMVESMRDTILSSSPLGICGALLAQAARTDMSETLPKLAVPTLLIAGSEDPLTPPEEVKSMHKRIPNSEFHVILGAAHIANLENSSEFNRHLLHFVQRLT